MAEYCALSAIALHGATKFSSQAALQYLKKLDTGRPGISKRGPTSSAANRLSQPVPRRQDLFVFPAEHALTDHSVRAIVTACGGAHSPVRWRDAKSGGTVASRPACRQRAGSRSRERCRRACSDAQLRPSVSFKGLGLKRPTSSRSHFSRTCRLPRADRRTRRSRAFLAAAANSVRGFGSL